MRLKEILKYEKERMSSFRWRINYIVVPIYIAVCFLPLFAVIPLMTIDADRYLFVMYIWLGIFLLATIAMFCLISFANKKETQIELERYAYLFTDPLPMEGDSVRVTEKTMALPGEEATLSYVLTREGVRMEQPEEGEQVFDEARENSIFIPWNTSALFLATQSLFRRVHIALAVFSTEAGMEGVNMFIPLSKELFSAMKAFGLMEKLDGQWAYLFYNPQDAFKQILTRGRIVKMRNKNTGKVFVKKNGDFIEGEE